MNNIFSEGTAMSSQRSLMRALGWTDSEMNKPIIGIITGYLVAFYLMAQTLNDLPLGFVYAVWTGAGVALTALIGAAFWHEGFNAKKALGIVAIIAGVVLLKLGV